MNQRGLFQLAAFAAAAFVFAIGTAWADPADTSSSIEFNPPSPVADGTMVDVTGKVLCAEDHGHLPNPGQHCSAVDQPVTVGTIQIQQVQDGSVAAACAALDNGGDFEMIASGAPDGSGLFTTVFNTTGFAGMTIGFRTHFVPGGDGGSVVNQSSSECADLVVLAADDPFPDGTITFTQGFYGASPIGEAIVPLLIDEATCEEIESILAAIGLPQVIDCSDSNDRDALALFLTGEVGAGADDGFLPSGFEPGDNLAAQKITLLLNLNLAEVLDAPDTPILVGYFLNIDVVQDLVDDVAGDFIDPVFNNPELFDVCDDADVDQICDLGTLDLSALGDKVALLDAAGTTVEDILIKADEMLSDDLADIDVNGVTLTRDDVTKILGLINESYDEGVISGFVTAFDAD